MKYTKRVTHTLELNELQFSILQDLLWKTESMIGPVNDAIIDMRNWLIPNRYDPEHYVQWDPEKEVIVLSEEQW